MHHIMLYAFSYRVISIRTIPTHNVCMHACVCGMEHYKTRVHINGHGNIVYVCACAHTHTCAQAQHAQYMHAKACTTHMYMCARTHTMPVNLKPWNSTNEKYFIGNKCSATAHTLPFTIATLYRCAVNKFTIATVTITIWNIIGPYMHAQTHIL